eukprot:m.383945 g.383945  ORF g.383945 m.383945 type:complete len:485 (-) comp56260_c0_seq2:1134-2588(-)
MDLKLTDDSLRKDPTEVFDLLDKLGEGSYGSVYKALHKTSGRIVAIKQVPIDSDLQEIIKEISIMQQCDSANIVKYYGSYFKDSDLWIIMEYCGAGSVADIMRLRKQTLKEDQIACILKGTLKGLEYLHSKLKIHRDIKAGNILLNMDGVAKLADFGVAGQLADTMAKRNTVIGTPFWMAPEVIQEVGYDTVADIWSVGIALIELADGKPPYSEIHPMRAIFMIPMRPPPTLAKPEKWSPDIIDFLSKCVVKAPEDRPTASVLLQHPFIRNSTRDPKAILGPIIEEAMEILTQKGRFPDSDEEWDEREDEDDGSEAVDSGTLVPQKKASSDAAEAPKSGSNHNLSVSDGASTMVVNDDEVASSTMVVNSADEDDVPTTAPGTMIDNSPASRGTPAGTIVNNGQYKPAFMKHFDNEKAAAREEPPPPQVEAVKELKEANLASLQKRLQSLDSEMATELENLRKLYDSKRQPILAALALKKAAAKT